MATSRSIVTAVLSLLALSGSDDRDWTPLHKAVRRGDPKAVRRLFEEGCVDANARGPDGLTPLMLAAAKQPAMVSALLPTDVAFVFAQVDVGLADDEGRTALMHAVRTGNFAAAARLLEEDPGSIRAVDRSGRSAFDYAVQQDVFTSADRDRVNFLHNTMWASPPFHGWGKSGMRPPPTIDGVARDLCEKKLAGWDLLARLAMVYATVRDKAPDEGKRDVILCAAHAGIDLTSLSATHPLDFPKEVVDDRGYTPRMIIALESGKPLPSGTDLSTEIINASSRGLEDVASALAAKHTGSPAKLGNALHRAAMHSQAKLVERLLAVGAPVEGDAESHRYETPLVVAARNGCRDCVKALLAAKASLYPGSHPSEAFLPEMATAEIRPLLEAAMKARRPDDARRAVEERRIADAVFAALLENYDRRLGVVLFVRNEPRDRIDPAVPGIVPTVNLQSILWMSPTRVSAVARRSSVDTRPRNTGSMFLGSGLEVTLEKRAGAWVAINVRTAWIE
jgi:ankyrin repeat protein